MPTLTLGLERCLQAPPDALRGARIGLLANQASVDRDFRYAHDLVADRIDGQLAAVFSPQHGLWSEEQDNMVESGHGRLPRPAVPLWSLYSGTRRPESAMLEGLDVLLVDLQDVGVRVYTYVWTVTLCLEACAERGLPVVLLDRPNPLGGTLAEGALLDPHFHSFVGGAPIPLRHGLTIGELVAHVARAMAIDADLTIVPLGGWEREHDWAALGRAWVPPSPNLPRAEGLLLYPGQVLVEGTNLSEGRGTGTPFELVGAPFIDPWELADALARLDLAGVVFRPMRFRPTFQKWAGHLCGGVSFHVVEPGLFRPVRTAASLLAVVRGLWPGEFRWLDPPYEYERERMPIDILSGSSRLREAIDAGVSPRAAAACLALDESAWWKDVERSLLY